MASHERVVKSFNARRFLPSYGMRSQLRNPNFMKMLMYILSQELPSSMEILNTRWLVMATFTTNGNFTLEIFFTFLLSWSPKIDLSSSCLLVAINDFGGFRDGNFSFTYPLLDDPLSIREMIR